MEKLILASASERRSELLGKLKIPFTVITPDVDESVRDQEDPVTYVERVSRDKALSVFENNPDCTVIGADTIVFNEGKILGKPKTPDEAYDMVRSLSGKSHSVITGVTIVKKESGTVSFHVKTEVVFDDVPDEEILSYVKTSEPYDKAGGYAIQGAAGKYIKSIIGCYYNVMGFPLNEIYRHLLTLNIS